VNAQKLIRGTVAALIFAACVGLALWYSSQNKLNDEFIHVAHKGNIQLAIQLLNAGANINACGSWEGCDTALLKAVQGNQTNMVKFLLENGAIPNATILSTAAVFGYVDIVKHLLAHGARVHESKENSNLYHWLQEKHQDELIKLLFPVSLETEMKSAPGSE